ncbi:aminodeoxychorismate synthase component I [Roseovarius aestuarii]|uniref:Aminodeoxychorismate synthase component 1 n=1 Tax=Roseovarius aestuarii TaxID=475083 RepID=A0A1X7BMI7_9RHOB|nr:aminodeoxychorismate synthase component I [Roseovarius aestuarii]SMC10509.1 Aminodeoxychorismate synthase component 1 [Roseovarius aestuarii]
MQIRFDHGPDGTACSFARAQRLIVAETPADVPAALEALDAARADGLWVAGYATYELGYVLEPKLAPLLPDGRRLPLIQLGVYDWPSIADALRPGAAELSGFTPGWDAARYASGFRCVHDYICAGDIYQANLTFPIALQAQGGAQALYHALDRVQPVRFGAMIEQEGLPTILSRSPELFFRTDTRGWIETRPMKGTMPRSDDAAEDARHRFFLQTDEKNRAENLMIVDLLRNDLSRISEPGSVEVPELFSIESYETVHQMTSLVTGQMVDGTGLGDIFRALFPCGSITGAPKVRAMEILRELEPVARDIYCGSIGWAAPDGRSEFNVAIRTLMVEEGQATLNVGGGLVYDSTAEAEYEEALWKARFARRLTPDFA